MKQQILLFKVGDNGRASKIVSFAEFSLEIVERGTKSIYTTSGWHKIEAFIMNFMNFARKWLFTLKKAYFTWIYLVWQNLLVVVLVEHSYLQN